MLLHAGRVLHLLAAATDFNCAACSWLDIEWFEEKNTINCGTC
jgi:hypothetical protein